MSKICKDGIIVNAQEYKEHRIRGIGRGISEYLFSDYKELMTQLRYADNELRQIALGNGGKIDIGIKDAIGRADAALTDNRLIDSLYYVGLIDVITRDVIAKAKPTVELLQKELYKQYSETHESESLNNLEGQSKTAKETFDIIAKYSVEINKNAQFLQNIYRGLMGGDPLQRSWQQEVRKFRQPVEKAVNSGYRFVERLISIFDRLSLARATGKIGDWVAGIDEIVKIQPALNKEVMGAYQRIQPIIQAAKNDQGIAAEQSKESKPVGIEAVIQDVAANIIQKIEPKAQESKPVNIPDLEIEEPSIANEEIQTNTEPSIDVVMPVIEPTESPASTIEESITDTVTDPTAGVVEPTSAIEEPVIDSTKNKAVEKVVNKKQKQKKEKVAPEVVSKTKESIIEAPVKDKKISNESVSSEIPEVAEPVVESIVKSVTPPLTEELIDEPIEESVVEPTAEPTIESIEQPIKMTEEESAEKYKEVLDIIDDFDELDTDDLYSVLNSVIEGAGNNKTIYRVDNGVESDIGRIDGDGNVEVIGTDLEFPRDMAEKILLYIDQAGLAPLNKAKTTTRSNIVEPKSESIPSVKEPVKEPVKEDENLFDKVEPEGYLDDALNQFESKVKEPESELDLNEEDEDEDEDEDEGDSEFGRLKGLTTEEELTSGNVVGEYEDVKAIVEPEVLQSVIDSNNRMIKSSGGGDDIIFDKDTQAIIVLYKGMTTYPVLMASSNALQNYLGKYVDIVADKNTANKLFEKYTLEGKKVSIFAWDKEILNSVLEISKTEKKVPTKSFEDEELPKEVKEKVKTTRKPRSTGTKTQKETTAAINHTRFFNTLKKAAKLNDPYLMAHMMVTYSQAMEGIDTEISINLLEKAKEILDV